MPSITKIWTTFVEITFFKSIYFKVKSTFEPNVFKWVIKTIFINSSHFALWIVNIKILSNFQKEWCTLGRKKTHLKKNKNCPLSRFECFEHVIYFLYVSNFEHVNFALMKNIPQKNDNPNYYTSFVIF